MPLPPVVIAIRYIPLDNRYIPCYNTGKKGVIEMDEILEEAMQIAKMIEDKLSDFESRMDRRVKLTLRDAEELGVTDFSGVLEIARAWSGEIEPKPEDEKLARICPSVYNPVLARQRELYQKFIQALQDAWNSRK